MPRRRGRGPGAGIAPGIHKPHNGLNRCRRRWRGCLGWPRNADEPEAVGEIARLTGRAVAVDRALLGWQHSPTAPAITDQHWRRLDRWVTSTLPAALPDLTDQREATLLRGLHPAEATDRSAGAKAITSLHDVAEIVATIRVRIHLRPHEATLAVVAAAARLGYAVTIGSGRASGETTPSVRTQEHAGRWRDLAGAVSHVADLWSGQDLPLAAELDRAASWMREELRAHRDRPDLAWLGGLVTVQQDLQRLCAAAADPLAMAAARGDLITEVDRQIREQAEPGTAGLHLAEGGWQRATPTTGEVRAVQQALRTVDGLPVTASITPAVRRLAGTSFAVPAAASTAGAGSRPAVDATQQHRHTEVRRIADCVASGFIARTGLSR